MYNDYMKKYRFVIVGSGWRSLFYVRIAKAMPDVFEVMAMLCRTDEKAKKIADEHDIYTTTSIEECKLMNPDFIVVAVSKSSIFEVTKEWLNYGFTVLCETPAALKLCDLKELWELHKQGKQVVVAEQYRYMARQQAYHKIFSSGMLGDLNFLHISLAHDYHGANLIRYFLNEDIKEAFSVFASGYSFNTTETLSRYEKITDGRISAKKRIFATFEFADGKVALYDFDSEQYRSPIRKNHLKMQAVRGEVQNNSVYWLDSSNEPQSAAIRLCQRTLITENENPNLKIKTVVDSIQLMVNDEVQDILYESPFANYTLSEEEEAIALLMIKTGAYTREEGEYALRNTLQDAYMAILMQKSLETGTKVNSEKQTWQ